MKTFICYVGILRPGLNKPISWLPKLRDRFSEAFAAGSSLTNGNSDFSIYLRFTRYKNYLIPHNESTQTYHLHKGLDRILGQQPLGWNLKELAVLYADEFTPRPGLFGIMFDTGFTGNLSNKRIPRQGCTVFLKPIMAVRTGEDLKKEIFFTTVHELGHVFNLWDRNYATPLSFMSTSDLNAPYTEEQAWHYLPFQNRYLQKCTTSKYVHPGGSNYGQRNSLGPPESTNTNMPRTRNQFIKLKISVDQNEFWYFEPIELDIKITNSRKNNKIVKLADHLDPGYKNFDIWIEKPNGETYKYLPTKRFCQNNYKIHIKPGGTYKRDISIFGQSGGYTFEEVGKYKIFCIFRISEYRVLKSNTLTVSILKPGKLIAERNFEKFTSNPTIAKLLYYRNGSLNTHQITELRKLTRQLKYDIPSIWNVHYAFGRNIADKLLNLSPRYRRKEKINLAIELLELACENLDSRVHRANKSINVIDQLLSSD